LKQFSNIKAHADVARHGISNHAELQTIKLIRNIDNMAIILVHSSIHIQRINRFLQTKESFYLAPNSLSLEFFVITIEIKCFKAPVSKSSTHSDCPGAGQIIKS
jgi:hypothetical protein